LSATFYKSRAQYRISRCVDQETHKQQKVLQVDAQQAVAHWALVENISIFNRPTLCRVFVKKYKSFKYKVLFFMWVGLFGVFSD